MSRPFRGINPHRSRYVSRPSAEGDRVVAPWGATAICSELGYEVERIVITLRQRRRVPVIQWVPRRGAR